MSENNVITDSRVLAAAGAVLLVMLAVLTSSLFSWAADVKESNLEMSRQIGVLEERTRHIQKELDKR